MDQIVVATVLGIHSEANQVVSGASRGRRDKLQKLDHLVLLQGSANRTLDSLGKKIRNREWQFR